MIFIYKQKNMRRIDKKLNLAKANLLSEQRYLASKGIIKEEIEFKDVPEFTDLIIVRTDTEFILVNKQDNTIEAQLGPIGVFKSKEHLCNSALRLHGELFEKLDNVYHGGGDIIGPLSACQKGGLEENEMSGEIGMEKIIPIEIFKLEEFDREDYDLVELNIGHDDSKLEMDFAYIETEMGCFHLKATVQFYFNISGSYRAATLYEPEEGPEEEFAQEEVVDIKYLDCSGTQEYQLTDEMLKIAIPHVLVEFEKLQGYISEKAWEQIDTNGPDGDDW
jgi:hypothetical protein